MKMVAALMAAGLVAAPMALAQTIGNGPVQSTDVGLDLPSGRLVATGRTDAKGVAMLRWTPLIPRPTDPVSVRVFITDRSQLKVAAVVRIEVGRQVLVSAPIPPGKGRGYASDVGGKQLAFTIRGNEQQVLKVTVTQAPMKLNRDGKPIGQNNGRSDK